MFSMVLDCDTVDLNVFVSSGNIPRQRLWREISESHRQGLSRHKQETVGCSPSKI